MERAPRGDDSGGRAGRNISAVDANRQTHQRGISDGCLDPADQHHDRGTRDDATCAALARSLICVITSRECATTLTASEFDGSSGVSGGQKAGRAETHAHGRAGSDRPRGSGACTGGSGARSPGVERLILPKDRTDR